MVSAVLIIGLEVLIGSMLCGIIIYLRGTILERRVVFLTRRLMVVSCEGDPKDQDLRKRSISILRLFIRRPDIHGVTRLLSFCLIITLIIIVNRVLC